MEKIIIALMLLVVTLSFANDRRIYTEFSIKL